MWDFNLIKIKNIHVSLKVLIVKDLDLFWFDKDERYLYRFESLNCMLSLPDLILGMKGFWSFAYLIWFDKWLFDFLIDLQFTLDMLYLENYLKYSYLEGY